MSSLNLGSEGIRSTRLWAAVFAMTIAFIAAENISLLAQSNSTGLEQAIPGTPLRVVIPQGWHIEGAQSASPPKIVHDGEPPYSVGIVFAALRKSCARQLADTEIRVRQNRGRDPNQPALTLAAPPSFIPEQFAPVAAFMGRDIFACMDLGTSTLGVIVTPLGDSQDLLVRPVLEALAKAALTQAEYISAPASATLPVLGIEVKMESGQYFVQPFTIKGKPRDTIVRLNSAVPLEISFIELKPTDSRGCPALNGLSSQMSVRKNPPYVQGRWYPSAWEWAPQEQLLANACYEASPQLLIVAWISYGKAEVGEQDASLIRELLGRVADSVDRGPHKNGQVTETASEFLSGPSPSGGVIGGIISSTPVAVPNVANPQRVRVSVGTSQGMLIKKVNPIYPSLARQARIQGTVLLQAEISKDGIIENLTLISGHPMLVPAAIEAVKQWVYRPYLLNNVRVAIETQIQVNFSLSPDPATTPGVNIGASSATTPRNK